MSTSWTETIVAVAPEHVEAVGSFLLDLGSPGLVTEEGDGAVTLTAYLAADAREQVTALALLCRALAELSPAARTATILTRPLPQDDWAHRWKDHFPARSVGDRLYVVPPWIDRFPEGRIAIVIDPGLAFGTGHHATTSTCLTLLERIVTSNPVTRALDLGTGSGILAIALAKLGVTDVWATDIDPIALQVARENCERNGVIERVQFTDNWRVLPDPFPLVVANLLSSTLIQLAASLASIVAAAGHLVVSGILQSEGDAVCQAFARCGFAEHAQVSGGESDETWLTLDLLRSPP
jgi:ribosomal protein L11 methyltransferase